MTAYVILMVQNVLDETPNQVKMEGKQLVVAFQTGATSSIGEIERILEHSDLIDTTHMLNVRALSPTEFVAKFEHYDRGIRIVPTGYLIGFERNGTTGTTGKQ